MILGVLWGHKLKNGQNPSNFERVIEAFFVKERVIGACLFDARNRDKICNERSYPFSNSV